MTAGERPAGCPVVCLMGPTASGKSAAAMALAERFADDLPIEIVSVDSAQVYRGMNVGTAKPSASDRTRVPHHLIDLIDPSEAYSAARFRTDAASAIEAIRSRGRLPVLVGGTMLYFKALRDGLDDLPIANPAVRARIEAEAAERGWPTMHAELARVDPRTAARLAPTDAQRIQRALEVWRLTGRPLSSFHGASRQSESNHRAPYDFLNVALEPGDRAILHRRIAERFDAMLVAGLVDEVRALRSRPPPSMPLTPDLPSMRCVGYRQAWSYLDGEVDAAQMRELGIAATRQLAKRQLTWLRALPGRIVVDCLAPDATERVIEIVQRSIADGAQPPTARTS